MTVFANLTFNAHGYARLAEDPGRGEDPGEILELQRLVTTKLCPEGGERRTYDLTIASGDHDLTFHGMTAAQLRGLGVELIRLAEAEGARSA